MTKEQIFEWFSTNNINLNLETIFIVLLIGLILGFIIYITYKITYNGVAYNSKFNATNVAILLITIIIMLMISSNIVISLGMVGALSIVRFRTAIKDPRDTAFIFLSIVEGLCVGSLNFTLAISSTLFICAVICLTSISNIARRNKYLVVIRTDGLNKKEMDIIKDNTKKFRIRNIIKTNDYIEKIIEIKINERDIDKLMELLCNSDGVKSCNILLETGETIG